ncbi:WD40 repeat-like protein [Imleria badia]|nr:WD40 repeat-like protein [Imleria badia]
MSSVIPQRSDNAGPRPQLVISVDDGIAETLAYLPDGRRVVTGSDDGTVKVWNLERGDQEGTSMKCKRDVFGLAVTRDGTRIISGDEDGSIKVWDVEFHELIREWTHEGGCFDISISPDDRLIAVADKTVIVYTVEGRLVNDAIEVDHDGTVLSVSFSPDGNKLACGTSGSDIRVYDVKSGKPILRPLKGHKGRVYRVLWSRDGSKIFSASHDKTIRCWNSDTGEQIEQPWSGHKEIISSLSLSPDGSILASASKDKTVRFWDANSGHPIGQQLEHGDRVSAVSFSSSGGFVVSTTWAGKLYLWRVPWLDSVESQTSQGTNLDMVHNTVHCAQLSLFPPVRDQNSTETDALRMSAMVPPDSDTMQYIFPYPYPTHHLELLQVRRTVPDFPFVPGADQVWCFHSDSVARFVAYIYH